MQTSRKKINEVRIYNYVYGMKMKLESYLFSCIKINYSCLKKPDVEGKLQTFVKTVWENFFKLLT